MLNNFILKIIRGQMFTVNNLTLGFHFEGTGGIGDGERGIVLPYSYRINLLPVKSSICVNPIQYELSL